MYPLPPNIMTASWNGFARLAKLSDTETGRLSNGTSMSVRSAMSRMTNAPEAIDGTGSE